MTGKTHLAGGLCAGLAATAVGVHASIQPLRVFDAAPLYMIPLGLGLCVVGSLFPDIDWHTSKVGSAVKPVSRAINFLFGHRTLFHSPFILLLIYLAWNNYLPKQLWYFFMFAVGAASHLLLDMLNVKGIPLFYPYTKHFHLLSIKHNGFGETLIRKILFGASVALTIVVLFLLIKNIKFAL